MLFADAAVCLEACGEIFRAERARFRSGRQRERAADADGIAELPWLSGQILLGDDVSRRVPAATVAGENQLHFQFPLLFQSRLAVRSSKIGRASCRERVY